MTEEQRLNETAFWTKVGSAARKAGFEVIAAAFALYECYKDKDTPLWAKAQIAGALAYFILPLDAVPDMLPVFGYGDDLAVFGATLGAIALHVKPEHRARGRERARSLFRVLERPRGEPTPPTEA